MVPPFMMMVIAIILLQLIVMLPQTIIEDNIQCHLIIVSIHL